MSKTLDEAWAACEAALLDLPELLAGPNIERCWEDWEASAYPPVDPDGGDQESVAARAATPIAALDALTAKLRERLS